MQATIDSALELIDTAHEYLGEARTAVAVLCAIIQALQITIEEIKCQLPQ